MRLKRPSLTNSKELFDRVRFRTKFEVALAEWNPRIDLLALGSSEGDVVVKRYMWKTGWKRNFSREQPLKQFETLLVDGQAPQPSSVNGGEPAAVSSTKSKDALAALCWSPDGQVLLAAFASGRCFFLDTQTGQTLFIRHLHCHPQRIQWLRYRPRTNLQNLLGKQKNAAHQATEQFATISASDFNFHEEASKEHGAVCANVEQFWRRTLRESLADTFLCVTHVDGPTTRVDILADAFLPVQQLCVEPALSACLKRSIFAYQISTGALSLMREGGGLFQIPFSLDDDENDLPMEKEQSQQQQLLEFSAWPVSPERMQIYSQIAHCLGWLSHCCLYLQEMHSYAIGNWHQASEAFHQRVFAVISRSPSITAAGGSGGGGDNAKNVSSSSGASSPVEQSQQSQSQQNSRNNQNSQQNSHHLARERALQLCRDLLAVLEDPEAPSDSELLEKFLGCPTTEKELKQAGSFVDAFTVLIKGISCGLLPATRSLRHAICTLRAHFCSLRLNMEEEDEETDPGELLLDTLLQIAGGHSAFNPTECLGQECQQFLDNFELSTLLLEQKLQTVQELAEQNRKELDQLLLWLISLIYESGNECQSVIDDTKFDLKLLNRFMGEVVRRSGLNNHRRRATEDKCILDRVLAHLAEAEEEEPTSAEAEMEAEGGQQVGEDVQQQKDDVQQQQPIPMEVEEDEKKAEEKRPEEDDEEEEEEMIGREEGRDEGGGRGRRDEAKKQKEEKEQEKQQQENAAPALPASAVVEEVPVPMMPPQLPFTHPHLVKLWEEQQQQGNNSTTKAPTVWQLLQRCGDHFRLFFRHGVIKFVHSPIPVEKCHIRPLQPLLSGGGDLAAANSKAASAAPDDGQEGSSGQQSEEEEEDSEDEEAEEEQMLLEATDGDEQMQLSASADDVRQGEEGSGRRRKASLLDHHHHRKKKEEEEELTLHAFIFGYDHQPTSNSAGKR